MYPCGAVLYRYLPQLLWMLWDVGHLGEWEHCGIHSMRLRPISLCHEGQVSLDGIVRRVWWVSRVAFTLSGWKSTMQRDLRFFFAHITILWHHVTGSPMGAGYITPSRTSWSCPALTSSCQCIWTGTGDWWATGLASGSTIRRIVGPLISGRVWCSHVLKVLDL